MSSEHARLLSLPFFKGLCAPKAKAASSWLSGSVDNSLAIGVLLVELLHVFEPKMRTRQLICFFYAISMLGTTVWTVLELACQEKIHARQLYALLPNIFYEVVGTIVVCFELLRARGAEKKQ